MAAPDGCSDPSVDAFAGLRSRDANPSRLSQRPGPSDGQGVDSSFAADASFLSPISNNQPSSSMGTEPCAYSSPFLSVDAVSSTLTPSEKPSAPSQQFSPLFRGNFAKELEQPSCLRPLESEDDFAQYLDVAPTDFDFSLFASQDHSTSMAPEFSPSSLVLNTQAQQQQHPGTLPSQSLDSSVSPPDFMGHISLPQTSAVVQLASPESQSLSHQQQQQLDSGPFSPPHMASGPYYTPQHSRNVSLDPASAAYMTNQSHPDWQAMVNEPPFQGHRRTPSEVSDVSSATHSPFLSETHSPYLAQTGSFDAAENNPSPLLSAERDYVLYDNSLGIESFTLSEQQQQQQGYTPAHSPFISPRLMPQQSLDIVPSAPFLFEPGGSQYSATTPNFTGAVAESGLNIVQGGTSTSDIGQASQMAPPSINVEFAPPSRDPNTGPGKVSADFDSLTPPPIRSRGRSKSDPFAHSAAHPRSRALSSLEPLSMSSWSLTPLTSSVGHRSIPNSRNHSPARSNRRLSTSSIDNRNYILDLADPNRPSATSNDTKRIQKHPATFQCTLCPKRFTRAYNLRSHLRTHTDERPFVCTVCGKAFARQHDRKRHEGLHSGEKKFVCRGELSGREQWGCGRRFARADALGRHFRSEAGRSCIQPLLDEESQEHGRAVLNQQQQTAGHLQPVPQHNSVPTLDSQTTSNFILPAALLAQYPALQTLQWDQVAPAADDLSDIGGRSSFEASSGNEFSFEDDESGISNDGYAGAHSHPYGPENQGPIMVFNTVESAYP